MTTRATKARTAFTIITPCINAERCIAETINSVVKNTAVEANKIDLEYIIYDGGSGDSTTEIIREMFSNIKSDNISTTLVSEKDNGMYDALAKGLKMAKGDVCAYINAGDFYAPTAFETVLDIFETRPVTWLTGYSVTYSARSQMVRVELPYKYRSRLIRRGLYGTRLPYIQQESTFWRTDLNQSLDYDRLARFRYAGDFYLWKTFCRQTELAIVEAWLGGFKKQPGQLSENVTEYQEELKAIADSANLFDYLLAKIDHYIWHLPASWKKKLNNDLLFRFDHAAQSFV
jgi:glycosyltransferase involved in cell wall biosynthesis